MKFLEANSSQEEKSPNVRKFAFSIFTYFTMKIDLKLKKERARKIGKHIGEE
jgi:hypothetical protein